MVMHSAQFLQKTQGINAQARPQSGWLRRLFGALAKARSAVQAELRARRDAAELASMDDRVLRDIGISRNEIDTLVRGPVTGGRGPHLRRRATAVIGPVHLDRGDGPPTRRAPAGEQSDGRSISIEQHECT